MFVGNVSTALLNDCTVRLYACRDIAIVCSISASWLSSRWKSPSALSAGYRSTFAKSFPSAPVRTFSACAWSVGDVAATAWLRAVATSFSVPLSWVA